MKPGVLLVSLGLNLLIPHDAEHFGAAYFALASHGPARLAALALHLYLLGIDHLSVFSLALHAIPSCYFCHCIDVFLVI